MAILLGAFLLSGRFYRFIEWFMWVVSILTLLGLLLACAHPAVLSTLPAFLKGLVVPDWPPARPWNADDATRLLTAITFAGLGGFWTLFLLTAVIGFIGTVIYTWALVYLNYSFLPRTAPDLAQRSPPSRAFLVLAGVAYSVLAILYLAALLR